MKKILLVFILAATYLAGYSQSKILITTSDPDAVIKVDENAVGQGSYTLVLNWQKKCAHVTVEKLGYITSSHTFCTTEHPPKTYSFLLVKDESYDASSQSQNANNDISIVVKKNLTETDAWKLIGQIVTDKFDVIEVSDKETGYMRTSWVVQSFNTNTIRTRLIVKLGDTDPLTYKIKVESEYSGASGTSVNADEKFKEWDRVLRKYDDIFSEFQTRLGGT